MGVFLLWVMLYYFSKGFKLALVHFLLLIRCNYILQGSSLGVGSILFFISLDMLNLFSLTATECLFFDWLRDDFFLSSTNHKIFLARKDCLNFSSAVDTHLIAF